MLKSPASHFTRAMTMRRALWASNEHENTRFSLFRFSTKRPELHPSQWKCKWNNSFYYDTPYKSSPVMTEFVQSLNFRSVVEPSVISILPPRVTHLQKKWFLWTFRLLCYRNKSCAFSSCINVRLPKNKHCSFRKVNNMAENSFWVQYEEIKFRLILKGIICQKNVYMVKEDEGVSFLLPREYIQTCN